MRRLVSVALAAALFAASAAVAQASDTEWPQRPIRLIVPFPAGASTDIIARILAQKMGQQLGQQIVIENRAGASGNIGADAVAKAAPDGYTIGVATASTHAVAASLSANLPYDPIKDFAPVTLAVSLPFVLVVHLAVPAHNVKELIQLAAQKPGSLRYASIGAGTMQQIAAELFKLMAGVDILHVPYKATGQYIGDLLGGRVSMMFTGIPPVLPHVNTGKLRALAVTTGHRSAALPDIPTLAESGVPGYEVSVWFGILAPAKTPHGAVRRLNEELTRILGTAEMRGQLANQGAEAVGNTPDQFARIMRDDMKKYAEVIRAAKIVL
jgi:tripartite-type tricarboxylate transporter receptor subunit TctC